MAGFAGRLTQNQHLDQKNPLNSFHFVIFGSEIRANMLNEVEASLPPANGSYPAKSMRTMRIFTSPSQRRARNRWNPVIPGARMSLYPSM